MATGTRSGLSYQREIMKLSMLWNPYKELPILIFGIYSFVICKIGSYSF